MVKKHLNLNQSFEWGGFWWLPEEPDEKVPGVLKYDGQGNLELSLIGGFEYQKITKYEDAHSMVFEVSDDHKSWDIIHGESEGTEFTLLGCLPLSSKRKGFPIAPISKQTISVNAAVIGIFIDSQDEPVFRALEISVEDLTRWTGISPFKIEFPPQSDTSECLSRVLVNKPQEPSVSVDQSLYSIKHVVTLPSQLHHRGKEARYAENSVYLRMEQKGPFSLVKALETMQSVQYLIALAMHRAAGLIWMRLECAEEKQQRDVHILCKPAAIGDHESKSDSPDSVIFTCHSIAFEDTIQNWCEIYKNFRFVVGNLLGLRYAPSLFVENNLLAVLSAAEAFHRGLNTDKPKPPFPKDKFNVMREKMLEVVPEEHRERFKSVIRNDPTLRDRLLVLADIPDEEAIAALIPNVEEWAKRTVKARNKLAHESKAPDHSFEELVAIVEVTTTVLLLNLLHKIGLPPERQRAILSDNPRLREVCRKGQLFSAAETT